MDTLLLPLCFAVSLRLLPFKGHHTGRLLLCGDAQTPFLAHISWYEWGKSIFFHLSPFIFISVLNIWRNSGSKRTHCNSVVQFSCSLAYCTTMLFGTEWSVGHCRAKTWLNWLFLFLVSFIFLMCLNPILTPSRTYSKAAFTPKVTRSQAARSCKLLHRR